MIIKLLRTKTATGILLVVLAGSVSKMVALPAGFSSGYYDSTTQAYRYMKPLARVPFDIDEVVDEYQSPVIDAYEELLHPDDSIYTDDECDILSQFQILDATGVPAPYNGIWDAWALEQKIVDWNETVLIDAGLFELLDSEESVKSLDQNFRKRKRGKFAAPGLMPLGYLGKVGVNPSTSPSAHFSTNTAQYALAEGEEMSFFWAVATFQPKKAERQTLFVPTLLLRQKELCDVFKHPYFTSSQHMVADDLTFIFKVLAGKAKLSRKEDGDFDLGWARPFFAQMQPANDAAFLDFLNAIERAKDALDDDSEQRACIASVLLFLETAFPEKDYDDFPPVVKNELY